MSPQAIGQNNHNNLQWHTHLYDKVPNTHQSEKHPKILILMLSYNKSTTSKSKRLTITGVSHSVAMPNKLLFYTMKVPSDINKKK